MKKILVPIDFSDSAWSGAQYAAALARSTGAEVTLLHVRSTIWPENALLAGEVAESTRQVDQQLLEWQHKLHHATGAVVKTQQVTTLESVPETLAGIARSFGLLVMGTNGAENYYQHLFGSQTYQVIERTRCPVLIIPDGLEYRPIDRITYAFDPNTNAIFLIEQLQRLAAELNVEVTVLHIAREEPNAETEHKMDILRKAIDARQHHQLKLVFTHRYGRDVGWELHRYMSGQENNLLAMSWHERTLMERLFTDNIIEKISRTAGYPVFVFWR
jgi:nucleotide-binding universal stress UspA family protein